MKGVGIRLRFKLRVTLELWKSRGSWSQTRKIVVQVAEVSVREDP